MRNSAEYAENHLPDPELFPHRLGRSVARGGALRAAAPPNPSDIGFFQFGQILPYQFVLFIEI